MMPHKTRDRTIGQRVRAVWQRIILTCFVLFVVAFAVAYVYSEFGPPSAFRQGAFAAFRQELAELPSYPESVVSNETDYDSALHPPVLELNYTLNGTCLDVHAYYERIVVANGWTVHESAIFLAGDKEIHSEFRKTVAGYSLDLIIACFSDLTQSPGYYFSIETA